LTAIPASPEGAKPNALKAMMISAPTPMARSVIVAAAAQSSLPVVCRR